MILTAEAVRLAAIEVLRPTGATTSFPTLAGPGVYDSREASVIDLDGLPETGLPYKPILALYTASATGSARGDAAGADDLECRMVLEVIGELAVRARDDDGGEDYVDAVAGSDPEARLVLSTLMAQVRNELLHSQRGHLFRRMVLSCERIDREAHAMPQLGLRFQREFMRLTLAIPNDEFSEAGGLSGRIKQLFDVLPAGSYAKGKLTELAAHLSAETRIPLDGIDHRSSSTDAENPDHRPAYGLTVDTSDD